MDESAPTDTLPSEVTPTRRLTPAADELASRLRRSAVQVVSPDGFGGGVVVAAGVLTNAHLIGRATAVALLTSDGARLPATVSRSDSSRDLALLTTGTALPAVELEPAAAQHEGDPVFVLGYPDGISEPDTLTRATISALLLNKHGVDMLQTETAMTPATSGSPVVNARGKVVGLLFLPVAAQGSNLVLGTETIDAFLAGAAPVQDTFVRDLVAETNQPVVAVSPIDASGSGFTITRIQPPGADRAPPNRSRRSRLRRRV